MHLEYGLGGNVVVIGDVMLDRYITGETYRISPEAPVPVVDVKSKSATLGGAGNVALNLVGLGCKTWLFGARGNDKAGQQVEEILYEHGIEHLLKIDFKLPTTCKTRILANNQQLLRFDEEGKFNGDNGRYDNLIRDIVIVLENNDIGVVIFSDYAKGVLSNDLSVVIIQHCRKNNIPVLVDPKRGDWSSYRGATLVKPNLSELKQATNQDVNGQEWIAKLALQMLQYYGLDSVLVTMGSKGMILVSKEKNVFIPASSREVFDVSGAGDTVIATMAACICSGYTNLKAAKIANAAAGVVVGKLGTCPITRKELEKVL